MDVLCETYIDENGVNRCQQISRDKRCIIQDSMTLHQSLEVALWAPAECPRGAEMRRKICECSCWSSIIDVYGPLMTQWGNYDDQVAGKLELLHGMCTHDVISEFDSEFSESSTTQCGLNVIAVTLNPVAPLPAGSVITIVGECAYIFSWWDVTFNLCHTTHISVAGLIHAYHDSFIYDMSHTC